MKEKVEGREKILLRRIRSTIIQQHEEMPVVQPIQPIYGYTARGDPGEDTAVLHVHSDLNQELSGAWDRRRETLERRRGEEEYSREKSNRPGNLLNWRRRGGGVRNHGGQYSVWCRSSLHLKIGTCTWWASSSRLWLSNWIRNIYLFFSMLSDAKFLYC